MFKLLLLLGALNALDLPSSGRYLELDDAPDIYMVIDAASIERQGATGTVRVVSGFKTPMPWDGRQVRIVQLVQQFDCDTGKGRRTSGASFTETLEVVQDRREVSDWSELEENSPASLAFAHVCRGAELPAAGDDLMTVLRAYWNRQPGGIAA